jgi:tRNA pseudouridine38-40 synthase
VAPEAVFSTLYKIALLLEYEGTNYAGFQIQPHQPTIQGELERALARLTGEAVRVFPASRTDAGTHAWGQVISFSTEKPHSLEAFVRGVNFYLPSDIRVQVSYWVASSFDPRRDAYAREYHYRMLRRPAPSALLKRYVHHVSRHLDLEGMRECANWLIGRRDFAPFSSEQRNVSTIRELNRLDLVENGDFLTMEVEGSAFLAQQIRRTAGALLEVGMGRLEVKAFQQMADSGQRGIAGPTLPANGLYLVKVLYKDFPPREGMLPSGTLPTNKK